MRSSFEVLSVKCKYVGNYLYVICVYGSMGRVFRYLSSIAILTTTRDQTFVPVFWAKAFPPTRTINRASDIAAVGTAFNVFSYDAVWVKSLRPSYGYTRTTTAEPQTHNFCLFFSVFFLPIKSMKLKVLYINCLVLKTSKTVGFTCFCLTRIRFPPFLTHLRPLWTCLLKHRLIYRTDLLLKTLPA